MSYDEAAVRWSRSFVLVWVVNVVALAVYAATVPPLGHLVAAIGLLFMAPELIGLWRHKDGLPPLTYVTRRYLPRWAPTMLTFALGVWLATLYRDPVFWVADAAWAGWMTNHWDVTYDGIPA